VITIEQFVCHPWLRYIRRSQTRGGPEMLGILKRLIALRVLRWLEERFRFWYDPEYCAVVFFVKVTVYTALISTLIIVVMSWLFYKQLLQ
jgi:hypothetical protein